MAAGKKTFIFYSDWNNMIRQMPDKDAGELLKHILSYVNDEDPETDNLLVKMAFGHIEPMLKEDLKKWDSIREKRKKAGSKGGKANAKQKQANAKQVEAVNVNDNVNDNVNVNVNDNKDKVYTKDVHDCFYDCLKYFPENLHPKKNNSWLDSIDKLNRIEKIPFSYIIQLTKKVREDSFWSKNFLSLTKLRKKNKDGILYLSVFHEQFKEKQVVSNNGRININELNKIVNG